MAKKEFKKGRFSELELYCIDQFINNVQYIPGMSLKEISEKMNRSESSIESVICKTYGGEKSEGCDQVMIDKIPVEVVLDSEKIIDEIKPEVESRVRNLFARRDGIAAMTPGASEAIDSLKSNRNTTNSKNEAAIFRQGKPDYSDGDKFNSGTRY